MSFSLYCLPRERGIQIVVSSVKFGLAVTLSVLFCRLDSLVAWRLAFLAWLEDLNEKQKLCVWITIFRAKKAAEILEMSKRPIFGFIILVIRTLWEAWDPPNLTPHIGGYTFWTSQFGVSFAILKYLHSTSSISHTSLLNL